MVINNQRGSVLILSLLFLSVMFCVLMIFIETDIFQLKQYAAAKRQFLILQTAENKLIELEQSILNTQLNSGYEKINDLIVTYSIEPLDEYDCVVIENKVSRFFKVNVLVENNLHEKIHLMTTFAVSSNRNSICKGDRQIISAGRQSWYQFE